MPDPDEDFLYEQQRQAEVDDAYFNRGEVQVKTIEQLLAEDAVKEVSEDQLGSLGNAVNRLLEQQRTIADLTEQLKQASAAERLISEKEIPDLMGNLGFDAITLKDGRKVTVKDNIQCAIPAAAREQAYKWLDENNHGDLIKAVVTAKFNRGDKEYAERAVEILSEVGILADLSESVHAGTLKAWARTEIEGGHSLPAGMFSVHIGKQTVVK